MLIARLNDASGVETGAFTQTLPYVFATVPALVSADHDSAVPPNQVTLSYPYPPGFANDLPVSPRPGLPGRCDVVVTLTFWRPQRKPIGEGPTGRRVSTTRHPASGSTLAASTTRRDWALVSVLCRAAFSETDPTRPKPPPTHFSQRV